LSIEGLASGDLMAGVSAANKIPDRHADASSTARKVGKEFLLIEFVMLTGDFLRLECFVI